MKLNPSMTKAMIGSRSRTIHPESPLLNLEGTVLKVSDDLATLGASFSAKVTFENHQRSVFRTEVQRLGIMRNSWQYFKNGRSS